jgi:hypothetical protein
MKAFESPTELKYLFLDVDCEAKKLRLGAPFAYAVIVIVLGVTGNLHWALLGSIPKLVRSYGHLPFLHR